MAEARLRWPFLTHFDASTIKNERQLVTMVKERCSRSQQDTEADVEEWMRGKFSETYRPAPMFGGTFNLMSAIGRLWPPRVES